MKSPLPNISFSIITIGILLCSACGSSTPAVSPTIIPTPTLTLAPTEAPPVTLIPTTTPSGAIARLTDAGNALIRITTQGTVSEPNPSLTGFAYGLGSGFIISSSGIAITNNHVVSGVENISVFIGGDEENSYTAEYIAGSECYDLAVIQIEGEGFEFLEWTPEPLVFGEEISLPEYRVSDQGYTFSKGIIVDLEKNGDTSWTAVDSLIAHTIKADVDSSGLPLLTLDGKVLGIHYGSDPEGERSSGISSDEAISTLSKLINGQQVDSLGLSGEAYEDIDLGVKGIWVAMVQPGLAAQVAGIKAGDIITKLDQQPMAEDYTMSAYCGVLRNHDPVLPIEFEIYRSSTGEVITGTIASSVAGASSTLQTTEQAPEINPTEAAGLVFNPDATQPGEILLDYQYATTLDQWDQFITNGDSSSVVTKIVDGKIQVDIQNVYTYSYYIFKEISVDNSHLEIKVANLGGNNNNVSLVCRYSEKGWYEFNVSSNGLFWIYRYNPVGKTQYIMLWNGGSMLINMGKAENIYSAICKDNHLTLLINGEQAISINDPILNSGKVGFAISSYNVVPISVKVDYFTARIPE